MTQKEISFLIINYPIYGKKYCCEKLNKQGHKIRWIGIELEEKWCNVAKERLSKIK